MLSVCNTLSLLALLHQRSVVQAKRSVVPVVQGRCVVGLSGEWIELNHAGLFDGHGWDAGKVCCCPHLHAGSSEGGPRSPQAARPFFLHEDT